MLHCFWSETRNYPAILVCFAAFWSFVVFVIGRLGGWGGLARAFPAQGPAQGQSWHFISATIGFLGSYRNALNVTVSPAGIYIRPILVFRIGHAPILIPWHAVTEATSNKFLFTTRMRLELRDPLSGARKQITFYGQSLHDAIEAHLR